MNHLDEYIKKYELKMIEEGRLPVNIENLIKNKKKNSKQLNKFLDNMELKESCPFTYHFLISMQNTIDLKKKQEQKEWWNYNRSRVLKHLLSESYIILPISTAVTYEFLKKKYSDFYRVMGDSAYNRIIYKEIIEMEKIYINSVWLDFWDYDCKKNNFYIKMKYKTYNKLKKEVMNEVQKYYPEIYEVLEIKMSILFEKRRSDQIKRRLLKLKPKIWNNLYKIYKNKIMYKAIKFLKFFKILKILKQIYFKKNKEYKFFIKNYNNVLDVLLYVSIWRYLGDYLDKNLLRIFLSCKRNKNIKKFENQMNNKFYNKALYRLTKKKIKKKIECYLLIKSLSYLLEYRWFFYIELILIRLFLKKNNLINIIHKRKWKTKKEREEARIKKQKEFLTLEEKEMLAYKIKLKKRKKLWKQILKDVEKEAKNNWKNEAKYRAKYRLFLLDDNI